VALFRCGNPLHIGCVEKPLSPADTLAHIDPVEFAVNKGRLYGVASILYAPGFDACAKVSGGSRSTDHR